MSDLVSVGFLVFNDLAFIREALDSLLAQTHSHLEILICDDCSTDGSAEVCRDYASRDSRIVYVRHDSNIGISRNMEFAVQHATGDYFFWAADDDRWDPHFVERLLSAIKGSDAHVVAFSAYQFIGENGLPLSGHPPRSVDYSGTAAVERIRKFAIAWDDGFGYGLFRRERIQDVRFPVWWGFNAICAYENIYPALCFFLARGNFALVHGPPLWFNRIKDRPNHRYPFSAPVKRILATILRKVNCYVKCVEAVVSGSSIGVAARVQPALFGHFFREIAGLVPGLISATWVVIAGNDSSV